MATSLYERNILDLEFKIIASQQRSKQRALESPDEIVVRLNLMEQSLPRAIVAASLHCQRFHG
jgi:hypothetical protein